MEKALPLHALHSGYTRNILHLVHTDRIYKICRYPCGLRKLLCDIRAQVCRVLAIAGMEYIIYDSVVYGVCAGGDMAPQAAPSAYGVKVGYLKAVFLQRIQYQFFAVRHLLSYMGEF